MKWSTLDILITPAGLKSSKHSKEFPVPTNLKYFRQFLGLTSHYRHFIQSYTKIAHPLYALTKKGAWFQWTVECEVAFETLKYKLQTPSVLVYPSDFVLETDASKHSLGAILSQCQRDNKLHLVAYASRSVSNSEANTNLETEVVWASTHFRYHLYRHNVTVITDHVTVKVVLGAPNLTGQHKTHRNST